MTNTFKLIFVILFLVSIAINCIMIAGKGIHIHNQYHQEQYQNQSQAQLLILTYAQQGKLVWLYISNNELDNMGFENTIEGKYCGYLETLSPEQALMVKMTNAGLFVPHIIDDKKEK